MLTSVSCAVVVQQVSFVGLQLYSEGNCFQNYTCPAYSWASSKACILFRVADGTPIVSVEPTPEAGFSAELDFGFSGSSAAVLEEPGFAQGEGKPRMHNHTLMFYKTFISLVMKCCIRWLGVVWYPIWCIDLPWLFQYHPWRLFKKNNYNIG